jgi:hypothetical protein
MIHFLIAAPLNHAMEKIKHISKAKILAKLTAIKSPQSVICFPGNNIVAIAGRGGCSLYNYSTNKEIKKLHEGDNVRIAGDINRKMLALRSEKKLEIYDITTQNKIWEKTSQHCGSLDYWRGIPAFNPIDDTILIGK